MSSSSLIFFIHLFISSTMVQINEVKSNSRENRTAAHTHIKGLGLRSDGTSEATGDGFVGQASAREVRDSSKPMKRYPFHGEPQLTGWIRHRHAVL